MKLDVLGKGKKGKPEDALVPAHDRWEEPTRNWDNKKGSSMEWMLSAWDPWRHPISSLTNLGLSILRNCLAITKSSHC